MIKQKTIKKVQDNLECEIIFRDSENKKEVVSYKGKQLISIVNLLNRVVLSDYKFLEPRIIDYLVKK